MMMQLDSYQLAHALLCCFCRDCCRVGLDIPTIEVRYEHLNIEAEAFVGSRALPSFINSATNAVEVKKWQILVLSFFGFVSLFCFEIGLTIFFSVLVF